MTGWSAWRAGREAARKILPARGGEEGPANGRARIAADDARAGGGGGDDGTSQAGVVPVPPGDPAGGAPARGTAEGATEPQRPAVPRWLQVAGGWAWRLLFIGIALYLAFRVASTLAVVVIPCAAAILLAALLQPVTARMRRAGMPALAATWCTLLGAVVVIAGVVTLVTVQVQAEYPALVTQVSHTSHQVQVWLTRLPFHLSAKSLQGVSRSLLNYLEQHKTVVAGTVVTGGKFAFEFFGGIALMLFITFFLLKDGERIWGWLTRVFSGSDGRRADRAGRAAWQAVVYYVRGTVLVASIHAVVIGASLAAMGVPIVAALVCLVFIGAFIPIVGLLFAGAIVILVTLATKGLLAAVVLLGIFVAEDQLESHLLQPLVVGRIVRLHPLAVILLVAVGGVVAGIPGAVVAVPIAAAITRAAPELRRRDTPLPGAGPGGDGVAGGGAPGP
jgi:predicted PurR-regulated permease PerM